MRAASQRTRLIQGFGQTETMATGSRLPDDGATLDVADPSRQSAGRAAYGMQRGIFNAPGQTGATGATGENWISDAEAIAWPWTKTNERAPTLPRHYKIVNAALMEERG